MCRPKSRRAVAALFVGEHGCNLCCGVGIDPFSPHSQGMTVPKMIIESQIEDGPSISTEWCRPDQSTRYRQEGYDPVMVLPCG